MTEIPEHLLKRSQARRAAMGGGGAGDAGDGGEAAATPTESGAAVEKAATAPAAAAATPTEVEPAKPEPVAPYVEAAQRRKRVPIWAVPVLAALPIWAFVYAATLEPPSLGEADPLTFGEGVYASNCATCHGATGGGGVGPALSGGAVTDNFADPADQIEWIQLGSAGFQADGRNTYGDNNTPINGGMPGWEGVLTPEEIAAVVFYERSGLSGEEPNEALVNAEGLLLVDGEPVVLAGGGGGEGGHGG
ncbi:MAG: cytochrome c [Acidimicrobiales bacterium]|nr:cytochrome c [Acidimicrobiales bacterium]